MDERPREGVPLKWLLAVLILGLAAGAAGGASVSVALDGGGTSVKTDTGGSTSKETRVVVQEQSAVSDAVARALPSVVTVINDEQPAPDSSGQVVQNVSVGSGVVVDDRGFIVTNDHVVENSSKLMVMLTSGEERPASLVSSDAPFTDLAVVKILPGGLKALPFGDSNSLVPGQTVIAIGSALSEFRNSVTTGVVSGLHRRWLRNGVYMEDLIQTDAAINNGNSGGPLITTNGEMVGIAANVVRSLGTADTVYGISFAISSNTMKPIVQSIIERGSYPRPYLGIDHVNVDATVAAQSNLHVDHGALVQRVVSGSPAQKAGLRPGDVILRIGNNDVNDDMPFINALARVGANDRVTIQFLRGSQVQSADVKLVPR